MNHKISHLKGFHKTTPNRPGALTSTWYTWIVCLPPTTFPFLWLRNKIHFAFVADTEKKHDFGSELNTKSLIWKDCRQQYQMGQVPKYPYSVLEYCVCLLLLLSSVVEEWNLFHCCRTKNMILDQKYNEQQHFSFEMVTDNNTRWIRCTNIHIVY